MLDAETESVDVYYGAFVDDMVKLLEAKQGTINICIETFLLLSYLANQNDIFKKKLEKKENFINVLQKIIALYSVIYLSKISPMIISIN
jgi:hypothetical protein